MFFIELFVFLFSILIGIGTCFLWGKIGGDEDFEEHYPNTRRIIKLVHHWWLGIILMVIAFLLQFVVLYVAINFFLTGFGFGLFLDDGLFHSFENYFQCKSP